MTTDMILRTISLILSPVVMITSCAIFLNGLITRMDSISSRMRAMHRERLELLEALGNKSSGGQPSVGFSTQRVEEIEAQLPNMLQRHEMLHNAVLAVIGAILVFVISMFIIGAAALTNSTLIAVIALLVFLIGTSVLLVGFIITRGELSRSQRDVMYEVQHGLSLKKEDLV